MAHTSNPGGGTRQQRQRPAVPGSVRWGFFKNEGYTYKGTDGKTRYISLGQLQKGSPTFRGEILQGAYSAKKVSRGGGWEKVGGERWKQLTAQGRTPHGFTKAPYQPGSGQWKKWTNAQNIKVTGAWTPALVKQAQSAGTVNKHGMGDTSSLSGNGGSTAATDATQKPPKDKPTDPNTLWARYAKMLGNPNTNQTEKLSDARHMADLQYGAQINDTRLQQAEGVRQAAQNQADIKSWFKALVGVNDAGKQANADATQAAGTAMSNEAQSLLAAIGGGAGHGAGQLAAQMLNDQANTQSLGRIQQTYQNNLDTALGDQQIGDMNAQKALDSQAATNLHQQLRDLLGQRGDAIVTDQQAIRAANNGARQANYGNRTSQLSSILGALQLQQNLKAGTIQLAGAKRQLNAQQAQGRPGGAGSGFIPWDSMNANQKHDMAMTMLDGGQADPNTGKATFAPLAIAIARAKVMHYNNPEVFRYLATYTQ